MNKPLAAVLCALLAAPLGAADPPRTLPQIVKDAREAYARGDKAAFLKDYEEAARLRPGDVWVLYNLACARAINGQTDAALAALRDFAAHRVAANLDGDKDFDSIRQTDGYRKVAAEMDALRKETITSGAFVAFTIPEKGLAPEGVAYDPATRAFFVASVNKGRVFRVGPDGRVSEFTAEGGGLKSALGIGVDARRRTLWVANETILRMNGGKEGDPPDSALFEYDLDTGRLRKRHVPPPSVKPPHFDDLTVAPDGRVYVNDGFNPRIYVLSPPEGELAVWLESDAMGGTQGLAATPDGKTLYVSDYRSLYRVDVATRRVVPIPVPADLALNGIDGLVYGEGHLVAIQNGIEPHRVILLELAPDGARIARSRILEMNHPAFDEPTLGTVVGGTLYFTANHQGHRFQDPKNPPKPEDLQGVVILRVPLK